MHYYTSQELADQHNISRRTITNWIEQTRKGKLDLELYEEENGNFYIVRSEANRSIVESIVKSRRKYLNKKSRNYALPKRELYELFTPAQIVEMVQSINLYNELPLKFTYMGKAADVWDEYANQSHQLSTSVTSSKLAVDVWQANLSYFDTILTKYQRVNVVDLCVGNVLPTRGILNHLASNGKLKKYVAIDISPAMLEIAKRNTHKWFNGKVPFEAHTRDITRDNFAETIFEPPESGTVNLVTLFGGIISNLRHPEDAIRTVSKSIGPDDIFVMTLKMLPKPETESFNFMHAQLPRIRLLLDLLGVDESYYKFQTGFHPEGEFRYGRLQLMRSLDIKFELPTGILHIDLPKGAHIMVYRANYNNKFESPKELLYKNGLYPILISELPSVGVANMLMAKLNIY